MCVWDKMMSDKPQSNQQTQPISEREAETASGKIVDRELEKDAAGRPESEASKATARQINKLPG